MGRTMGLWAGAMGRTMCSSAWVTTATKARPPPGFSLAQSALTWACPGLDHAGLVLPGESLPVRPRLWWRVGWVAHGLGPDGDSVGSPGPGGKGV